MNFFLGDLGAEGSLGSLGFSKIWLIEAIKNILQAKQIENLFRKYIIEFVQCQICKRQNTELVKDEKMRLWTLQCKNCKCSRTVPTIKGADKKYEDYELEEAKKDENNKN